MFNKDSFLLFAVVISTAVATSAAFTALQPHPDHPGKCYLPSTGRAYSVGELWPSASQCVQFECLRFRGRGGYVLGMESRQCPEPLQTGMEREDCDIVVERGAPFPECCPRAVCG